MATFYKYKELSAAQKQQITLSLQSDKAYHFLQLYLQQITSGHPVNFGSNLILSADAAWDAIAEWGGSTDVGLPVGDRGNWRLRANRLLNYLERTQIGAATQAGIAYYNNLEQAKTPLPTTGPTSPEYSSFSQAQSLRRTTIDALNRQAMGQLRDRISQSKFVQRFDPKTASILTALLTANAANLRHIDEHTPEKLNQLLLPFAGAEGINRAAHLLHSDVALHLNSREELEGELKDLVDNVNSSVQADYGGDEDKFHLDQTRLRALGSLSPTLSDIPGLIHHLASSSSGEDQEKFALALRREIILSSRGAHKKGIDILASALRSSGLGGDPEKFKLLLTTLDPLSSLIDEIEITHRQKLLSTSLFEKDPRSLSTLNLAAELGIESRAFWISDQDLAAISESLVPGSGKDKNYVLLQNAYGAELALGPRADLQRLGQLGDLLDLHKQRSIYLSRLRSDSWFATRSSLAKTLGSLNARSQPLDKFIGGLWGGINKVDDLIHWPVRTALDFWDKVVDRASIPLGKSGLKFPLLSPFGFLYDRWIELERRIALSTFKWSTGLARSGKWYSGIFRQVSDFSRAYFKSDANWGRASFVFFEKKWGNALNWAAQKAGSESWVALKASIGTKVIEFGMKVAPGLTEKLVSVLGVATSELGIGLLVLGAQALWEVGKSVVGKVTKLLGSIFHGNANNLWGAIPLALGSLFLAINAVLGGLPIIALAVFEVLRAAVKIIWESLVALFLLAAAVTLVVVAFFTLIWYGLITPTMHLDSNSGYQQLVAGIVCEEGGGGPGSAAICLAEYLTKCNLNPLFGNMVGNANWKCFLASTALSEAAKNQIEQSSHVDGHLQCVGLIAAYIAQAFNQTIPQINAKYYATTKIDGFTFSKTCKPGTVFVDTGGSVGHVGVVVECAGANVVCVDANYAGPGVTRNQDTCRYDTNKIAGYLTKI
ncbi:MAG: hypothetical protein ABII21_01965 [bacterium]